VLLYTDSVIEAHSPAGDFFGVETLLLLERRSGHEQTLLP
jgi:serine phosphatase RsbU (regulator of sigma subunit)